ncbi:MAG TPA: phenylalanine--tRNA ligase subunit beta [Gammaproteobacteria bacterium]|nr:phenylalanine--tRNA ligase subunit beta [Gammaproteobacteria bacterium]
MKLSATWLREWVDFAATAEELADELTLAGLEVDSVERLGANIVDVVAARVETVEPHPQADRLKVCRVFDGSATHEVVCGAPNVYAGMLAPLARVGGSLPGGAKIKASKLRGVRSNGMLCSGAELGVDDDVDGLLALGADAVPGQSVVDLLDLDDSIIDVDLTPNRGDCFSLLGVAREIAARRAVTVNIPDCAPVPQSIDERYTTRVLDARACPRLCTRVVRGVDNERPVPLWLRERLRRSGLRSISPIVDVTNYVMLEFGQPLHAYDLNALNEYIEVRFAHDGESLELLTEKSVDLAGDVLVIADARGPIGLAGIMGGAGTGVTNATADVVFESAFFAPESISGRARRFGLHTDASVRFERGVDPEQQARAIERATRLLIEIAGGAPGPTDVCEGRSGLPGRATIDLSHDRLNAVLGMQVSADDVRVMLSSLEMRVETTEAGWLVTPPGFRFDIAIAEDLIEEVGRMIGYDRIPVTPAFNETHVGAVTEHEVSADVVIDTLVDRGYQEIVTYSFIDPEIANLINPDAEPLQLTNPISSDLAVMRRSLWPGLLLTAKRNLANQVDDLQLFEYGPQFDEHGAQVNVFAGLATGTAIPGAWDGDRRELDFFDVKRDVEALLGLSGKAADFRFDADDHPALRPGQTARITLHGDAIGWLGVIHPALQKRLDLRTSCVLFSLRALAIQRSVVPKFDEYSRLPFIRRDVAFIVDENVTTQQIIDQINLSAGPNLEEVTVFDLYRGKGIDATGKSVALGLILRNASRTLTDADADKVVSSVTQRLQRELGARIRT